LCLHAYLFWRQNGPKMAQILQFYVINGKISKPPCSYLILHNYLQGPRKLPKSRDAGVAKYPKKYEFSCLIGVLVANPSTRQPSHKSFIFPYCTQCGNFMIFLSLRFYVRSDLKNLEVPFLPFLDLWILLICGYTLVAKKDKTTLLVILLTKSFYLFWPPLYSLQKVQKFIKRIKIQRHKMC